MSAKLVKRASLSEIRRMKDAGELHVDPATPEGESLGRDFWAKAKVETPKPPRSVHLKLDPDVFDFFYRESRGKGHLTRMQNVLKAFANAHRE